MRYKQPKQYLEQVAAGAPLQEEGVVTREDVGFEFMLNALRLTDGVPATLFAERTGYPLALVQRELAAAEARGLLERDPATIRPTALGPALPERPAGSSFSPIRTREARDAHEARSTFTR